MCAVDPDGSRRVAYANSHGSVRPAVVCGDLSELPCKTVKDISGFEEAEFGEYPQNAADRALAGTLEQEFAEGMLRTTTGGRGVYKIDVDSLSARPYITADYSNYNGMNGNNINAVSYTHLAAELPFAMLRLSITQHSIPARHNSCAIKAPVIPEPTMTISVDLSLIHIFSAVCFPAAPGGKASGAGK